MKEIYKHVVGYLDKNNNYFSINGFEFHKKLSVGKYARYKNVFVKDDVVIKGETKVKCRCSMCGVERVMTMASLRQKEDKHYKCNSCCMIGIKHSEQSKLRRFNEAIANYKQEFGSIEKYWLNDLYTKQKKSLSEISAIITGERITNKYYRCISYIKKKLIEYNIHLRDRTEWMKIPSIVRRNTINGSRNKRISSLNIKTMNILDELKVDYIKEYILGNHIYDIYIPNKNILIECNGDYWHCNPDKYEANYIHNHSKKLASEIWAKDAKKKFFAESKGYKLLIYWEEEIKSDNFIKELSNGLDL